MVRLVAVCLIAVAATQSPAAKYEHVRRVGLISAIGNSFAVQKIGITALGNERKEIAILSWKVDELVIAKIRSALAGQFDIRSVSYRGSDFQVTGGSIFNSAGSQIAQAVRQVSPQGLDAYVVVTKGKAVWPQTNQLMSGLGIIERDGLGSSTVKVFALIRITVINGRDFTVLDSADGLRSGDASSVRASSREVDKRLWPAALDAGAVAKLKTPIVELLGQSVPETLQHLELTR